MHLYKFRVWVVLSEFQLKKDSRDINKYRLRVKLSYPSPEPVQGGGPY